MKVPVRKANVVPSIFLGVILANNAKIGRKKNKVSRTPKMTSENNKKMISGIPISRFQRFAKTKLRKDPIEPITIAQITMVLVSTFLHQALYISAPIKKHMYPIRTIRAKTNFVIPTSFNRKK